MTIFLFVASWEKNYCLCILKQNSIIAIVNFNRISNVGKKMWKIIKMSFDYCIDFLSNGKDSARYSNDVLFIIWIFF